MYESLGVVALARTANSVSNEELLSNTSTKLNSISESLGITFTSNSVTGNETSDRLDILETKQVPSLGDDYTIEYNDVGVLVSTTSTITLPNPKEGYEVVIKKIDNIGTNTVVASGVGLIEGNSNYTLNTQWEYVRLLSDGTNWYVVGK